MELSSIFTTKGIINFLINELKAYPTTPLTFKLDCSKCLVDYIKNQINNSGLGKWEVEYAENSIIDVLITPNGV